MRISTRNLPILNQIRNTKLFLTHDLSEMTHIGLMDTEFLVCHIPKIALEPNFWREAPPPLVTGLSMWI